jgi:hypothetical protein
MCYFEEYTLLSELIIKVNRWWDESCHTPKRNEIGLEILQDALGLNYLFVDTFNEEEIKEVQIPPNCNDVIDLIERIMRRGIHTNFPPEVYAGYIKFYQPAIRQIIVRNDFIPSEDLLYSLNNDVDPDVTYYAQCRLDYRNVSY